VDESRILNKNRQAICFQSADLQFATYGESFMSFFNKAKKCKHSSCSCVPADGKDYCSEVCKNAKKVTELTCQCNHQECKGEPLKA